MTFVLEAIAIYALGAIIWFFLSFIITVSVMAFTHRLSALIETSSGERGTSEPWGGWLIQWFLLWPITIPLVLWAAVNGMTLADLKRHFQSESEAKYRQGYWRKTSKSRWVHIVPVSTGIVVTHAIAQRPTKTFERKMFEMARVGVVIPFGGSHLIDSNTFQGVLYSSLSEAKKYAESDKGFLEECKRKS